MKLNCSFPIILKMENEITRLGSLKLKSSIDFDLSELAQKKCLVLGTGQSLGQLNHNDKNFDYIILVNFCKEQELSPDIVDILTSRPIIIFSNYAEHTLDYGLIKKLDIIAVYYSGFNLSSRQNANKSKGRDFLSVSEKGLSQFNMLSNLNLIKDPFRTRRLRNLNKYGLRVNSLPLLMDPFFTASMLNAGLKAIHFSACFFKEVVIYGIDFYSVPYFTPQIKRKFKNDPVFVWSNSLSKYSEFLFNSFQLICEFHPNIKFNIHSHYKPKNISVENLNFITL